VSDGSYRARNTDVSGAGPVETVRFTGSGGARLRGCYRGGQTRPTTGHASGEGESVTLLFVARRTGAGRVASIRWPPVPQAQVFFARPVPQLVSVARPRVAVCTRRLTRAPHRALAARRQPSLPRPNLSGLASPSSWSSYRAAGRNDRSRGTRLFRGPVGKRCGGDQWPFVVHCFFAPNRHLVSPPLLPDFVSSCRRIFFCFHFSYHCFFYCF
jgi:hypothetical protein